MTEFLPISSSGHLVLVPWLLGWSEPGLTYDAVVHLGTAVVVLWLFRQDVLTLARAWLADVRRLVGGAPADYDRRAARLAWMVVVSALPAALAGYALEDWFSSIFGNPRTVSVLLVVTGTLLLLGERFGKQDHVENDLGWRDALFIGVFQSLAIAPGISRSGATISAGLFRGLNREEATHFAFLMGIPIIVGAAAYQLLGAATHGYAGNPWMLLLGALSSAVSGYFAIRFLLHHVRTHGLVPFALYCFSLAVAAFVLSLVR